MWSWQGVVVGVTLLVGAHPVAQTAPGPSAEPGFPPPGTK